MDYVTMKKMIASYQLIVAAQADEIARIEILHDEAVENSMQYQKMYRALKYATQDEVCEDDFDLIMQGYGARMG